MGLSSAVAIGAAIAAGVALSRTKDGTSGVQSVLEALHGTAISPTTGAGAYSSGPVAPSGDQEPSTTGPSPMRPAVASPTSDYSGMKDANRYISEFGRVVRQPLPYTPGVSQVVVPFGPSAAGQKAMATFQGYDDGRLAARWQFIGQEVRIPWDVAPDAPANDGSTRNVLEAARWPSDSVFTPMTLATLLVPLKPQLAIEAGRAAFDRLASWFNGSRQ